VKTEWWCERRFLDLAIEKRQSIWRGKGQPKCCHDQSGNVISPNQQMLTVQNAPTLPMEKEKSKNPDG
jgi:hypothetical protein